MSGGSQIGASPMQFPGGRDAFMKGKPIGGKDNEPITSAGPGMQEPPAPTNNSGGSGFNISGPPSTFYGTPFNQTYGGQPAPYADLGAQILDSFRMYQNGAGRFGNNMASRFSFQGGTPPWRPDVNQNREPIAPYGYNPMFRARGPGGPPTTSVPPGTPTKPPGKGAAPGGVDHMANFQKLYAENPALAYQYTYQSGAQPWFFQNQNAIKQSMFQGNDDAYNNWINGSSYGYGPGGGNNPSLASDPSALARIRAMAGGV
jgi:hypothetical protein